MEEPLITLDEAAKIIGPSRGGHLHPRKVLRRWCEVGVVENGQRIFLEYLSFGSNDLKTKRSWVEAFGRERAAARRRKHRPAEAPTPAALSELQERARAIAIAARLI